MPNLIELPRALRRLLFGRPVGEVWPPKPNPPPPANARSGRKAALTIFREYVCSVKFYRRGDEHGRPIPFSLDPENFHLEWPDSVTRMHTPHASAVVLPGPARWLPIGLTSILEEDTLNVFHPGTALKKTWTYSESFQLEIWAATAPHLDALFHGFDPIMSPVEEMAGLRFSMPDYYDRSVTFVLTDSQHMDDANSARMRRRLRFTIEMRYDVVDLVNVRTMRPLVTAEIGPSAGIERAARG